MSGIAMKELGSQIREKRKEKRMSQETLAAIIGVTKSTISKYELGLREPGLDHLLKIADALSLPPFALVPQTMEDAYLDGFNYLLRSHNSRYHDAKTEEEAEEAENDVIDILCCFNELDEFGQKRAVACVRALAGYEPIIDINPPHPIDLVLTALCQLNDEGQQKAVERVEELTEIPKYKKEPPQD